MIAKTHEEREGFRVAGKLLARILHEAIERVAPGVRASDIDAQVLRDIQAAGAVPVFIGYPSPGRGKPYPCATCISVNDEVVHGIPTAQKMITDGDVVSVDCALSLGGFIADMTLTAIAGTARPQDERLVAGVREARDAAVAAAKAGGYVGDIGAAVAAVAEKFGLSVVRDLGGHGVGHEMHEAPFIANFGTKGRGEKLEEHMVLALEPILVLGHGAIVLAKDGWTYKTRDHSRAAEFEDTIIVGKEGGEIVTRC